MPTNTPASLLPSVQTERGQHSECMFLSKGGSTIVLLCTIVFFLWSQTQRLPSLGQLTTIFAAEVHVEENQRKNTSSMEENERGHKHRMIILIHSGASLKKQRDRHRQACFPHYKSEGIPHKFVVGIPSTDDRWRAEKGQGILPTKEETNVSAMLLDEHERYGDIVVAPNRDYYRQKTEKILFVLRYGVESGADYIVKPDDDRCVNTFALKRMTDKHEKTHPFATEMYGGYNLFKGDEYNIMKGPHGEMAPFMSGPLVVVSRGLAETIVGPDWIYNVLYGSYGTSSDDANLGKMVAKTKERHNMSIAYSVEPQLCRCRVEKKDNITQILDACRQSDMRSSNRSKI